MKTSSLLTVAALTATPVLAQTDECAAATDLGTGPTSIAFDTNVAVDTGTLATNSAETQCFSISDDVWVKYTAAQTGLATFSTCNAATFDTELAIWEGGDCATMVGLGCNDDFTGCTGFTSEITVNVTAGTVYHVQIGHFNSTSGSNYGAGTLTITEFLDPCTTTADDGFEDNDDCLSASALGAGSNTGLFINDTDDDFYAITIPTGNDLEFSFVDQPAFGDIDWELIDATDCTTILASSTFADDGTFANATGADQDVVLRLFMDAASSCSVYDLDVSFTVSPCATADQFEPNTDCASAAALGDGSYTGLNVSQTDNDYYAVTVADGDTLTVDATFLTADGDIDVYIWDPLVACDSVVNGEGAANGSLANGFTGSDNESVTYTNMSGAAQNLVVEINIWDSDSEDCNTYDLDITGTTGGVTPTGVFCNPGNPNSTGAVGVCAYVGSASVAANNATLTAANIPAGQFGIFVTSTTITAPIPVANGFLCLGGDIGRYQTQIWQADPMGNGSLVIDLTAIPTTSVPVAAMAGETRGFQGWHRDAGGAGANFTEGVSVTFTP